MVAAAVSFNTRTSNWETWIHRCLFDRTIARVGSRNLRQKSQRVRKSTPQRHRANRSSDTALTICFCNTTKHTSKIMQVIRQWLCVIGLAASALAATGDAPAAPPNVIVITLDTTRADRMGFLGSKRGLTPNLDAFARQSAVFTQAYS